MKQSTTFASVANKFSKVLQGYTMGIRFTAILTILLTMGIGEVWGANTGHTINYPYFYYYNDASWSNVSVIFGRSWTNDNYTKVGPMTLVSNTEKLYFRYIEDNWNYEYNQIAVLHGSWAWPSGEGKNIESRWDYATNKQHTDNIVWNHDMNYQEVHYWGGKSANSISREVPKYTTTLNIKVKESGQATYSNATLSDKPASTIKLTGTYLSSAGKTTRSEASWTTNSSCEYESVISGKVTPAYEGLNTDWTFDGWYVNSTKISLDKNYDFYQTANTTIEARFTKTVKYTVTWKVNGEEVKTESVAYNSKVTTLPTAPTIDCNGKVFVGWSNQEVTNGQKPTVLFTTAGNAPDVTGATTYHAVFADQEGFDGNVDFSAQGWTNGEDLDIDESTDIERIFNIAGVTLQFFKNSGSYTPQYYTTGEAIRLYPKNQMKVSVPSDRKITSINFTFSTGDGNNTISPSLGPFDGTTWTGNASSVTFTIGGETGHRRISSIQVSVDGAGTVSYSNYTTSCIPIYTITYDLKGGSGGCAEAEVEKGQSHTICNTEPTRTGYTFQGWSDGTNTYAAGATISNVQSDIILTAVWQENTYVVHFDANGGTGGTMADQNFNYTESKTLTANAFTKSSSVFAYWNTKADGTGTKYNDKQQVSKLTDTDKATITLYAQWSELYTVTFIDRGSVYANVPQTTVDGNVDFPDDPTGCEGYTFEGWSETEVTDASSYQEVTSIAPKQDTRLYAVYSKTENGSGGTETVKDELTHTINGEENTNTGYVEFSGKSYSSNAVYAGNTTNGNNSQAKGVIQLRSNNSNSGIVTTTSGGKAKNISVEWHSYTIDTRTLDIYGKNTAYSDATELYNNSKQGTKLGSIVKGTSALLTITGDYQYIGLRSNSGAMYLTSITITWETSGGGSTTTYTTTPDCCTPLDEITGLTFSAMTRSITVSVPDSYDNTNVDGYIFNLYNAATGSVATTYDTNDKNEKSHTFTSLNPNTAYYFTIIAKGSGAYCNSEETSLRESSTTLPQYTVTWNPAGGHWSGNYNNKVDTYDYQAAIAKPADPERNGYTFNGWDKTPATIMPAENLTYTAQWNIVTYTITYENLNGATHTNPKDYTVETATITLTDPTERAGYVFAGWYSDANYTTKVTQITQGSTDNITLYAKWLEIFTITWMANGVVYVTTEVVEGEPITPPASPDAGDYCGQVFAGWTDAEMAETTVAAPTLYPTPNPFSKASADATFYAVFADYQE